MRSHEIVEYNPYFRLKQDILKKQQKLSNFGPVLNKQLQLKRVTKGAEPHAAG